MGFEWDPGKAEANERKHGVLFGDEAVSVFEDDHAITIIDHDSDPIEERFVTLGMSHRGRVIAVAYTYRTDTIRIISARKATSREEQAYFEK